METEKVFAVEAAESQKLFESVQEIKLACDKDLAEVLPLLA